MDVSWIALVIFPILITPASLMLWVFRWFFPRGRFLSTNNWPLFLTMIFLGGLTNLDLIFNFARRLFEISLGQLCTQSKMYLLFHELVSNAHPENDFIWKYLNWFNPSSIQMSVTDFLYYLHIRPFVLTIIILSFIKAVECLNDRCEAKKFLKKSNNTSKRSKKERSFIGKILDYTHSLISHPWVLSTRYNKHIEILMLDVHMEDGNLYMGKLTGFHPVENEISSLSMTHILRYSQEAEGTNTNLSKGVVRQTSTPPIDGKTLVRMRIVNHDGEIFFPYEKIRTIHIWNLMLGTTVDVSIYDRNSEELFRWYLSLSISSPDIITSMKCSYFGTQEDFNEFIRRFKAWEISEDITNNIEMKFYVALDSDQDEQSTEKAK